MNLSMCMTSDSCVCAVWGQCATSGLTQAGHSFTPRSPVAPHSSHIIFLARLAPRPRPRDPRATRPPADISIECAAPTHGRHGPDSRAAPYTQVTAHTAPASARRAESAAGTSVEIHEKQSQLMTDRDGRTQAEIYETTERERRRISAKAQAPSLAPLKLLPTKSIPWPCSHPPSSLCPRYSVPLSDTWNMDNT